MVQLVLRAFITVLALCASGFVSATVVSGTSIWSGDFAESAISNDLKYADGAPYSDLPVFMICVDVTTTYPTGDIRFNTAAGGTALKGGSGAAGVAAIHWLFDQYYSVYFKGASDPQKWAFQYAVWELGNDYNGTASSIQANTGQVHPFDDGYFSTDPAFISAYQAMYQAMLSRLPSLPTSYRSKTYTIDLFNSEDASIQNMVALIERAPPAQPVVTPTPVPTLEKWALIVLFSLMGMVAMRSIGGQPLRIGK